MAGVRDDGEIGGGGNRDLALVHGGGRDLDGEGGGRNGSKTAGVEAALHVFPEAGVGAVGTSGSGLSRAGGLGEGGGVVGLGSSEGGFWLMVSVRSIRSVSSRVFDTAMRAAWKPMRSMRMLMVDENLFKFFFEHRLDINKVLLEAPWRFDGHPLAIKEITAEEVVEREQLTIVPYWVQFYGIPVISRLEELTRFVASLLGNIIEVDSTLRRNPMTSEAFVRARVELDTADRLPRGTRIAVNGVEFPLAFKFERLFKFCHACGMVNHEVADCEAFLSMGRNQALQYGEWMKGIPPRQAMQLSAFMGGNPFAPARQMAQVPRYDIPKTPVVVHRTPIGLREATVNVENRVPILRPPGVDPVNAKKRRADGRVVEDNMLEDAPAETE